jgi:hypothetical protein
VLKNPIPSPAANPQRQAKDSNFRPDQRNPAKPASIAASTITSAMAPSSAQMSKVTRD